MIYINFTGPSGTPFLATVERLSDGYYREDDSETFVSAPSFVDKDIVLTEGTDENRGSYGVALTGTTWSNGLYKARIHQSGTLSTVGSMLFGVWNGQEVPVGDETPMYFAQIKYVKDATNGSDEYSTIWYRNDQVVTSGQLTNPAISVYNSVNGTALFQNQTMSYASHGLGIVRYNDTSFLTASGEPYVIHVSGTIDSANREWRQIVGLDLY